MQIFLALTYERTYKKIDRWEGSQKHNSYLIQKMYILRFEVKQHVSALYGHPSGFFSLKVSLYKLREKGCDVEISHPIIILVCLCIGGYYITLIYIYIYHSNIIPAST